MFYEVCIILMHPIEYGPHGPTSVILDHFVAVVSIITWSLTRRRWTLTITAYFGLEQDTCKIPHTRGCRMGQGIKGILLLQQSAIARMLYHSYLDPVLNAVRVTSSGKCAYIYIYMTIPHKVGQTYLQLYDYMTPCLRRIQCEYALLFLDRNQRY